MKFQTSTIDLSIQLEEDKNVYEQSKEAFKEVIELADKHANRLFASKYDKKFAKAIRDLTTIASKLMEENLDLKSDIIKMKDALEKCTEMLGLDEESDKD